LQLLASITAQRSAAALSFFDVGVAQANLATLAAKTSIRKSCFFSLGELLFTGYPDKTRCPQQQPKNPGITIDDQRITVLQPVEVDGRIVGMLWLEAELDELNARTWRFANTSLGIAALSALLAYALAAYLTRQAIAPIAALISVAKTVRDQQDYSQRVPLTNYDETGALVESFNAMLDTIQQDRQSLQNLIGELESLAEQNALHASSADRRRQITQQFFAGLSHDLRQPLQAIDLYAAVLKEGRSPNAGETLTKLRQAVSNLDQLFRELLDAARFESQLDVVQARATVDMTVLLNRIHQEFEAVATQKGIRLRLHAPETSALSDVRMLERILRNLVSNAIRYTNAGGVLIALRGREQEVWLEVWDTGRGIPEEKLESMFTPYHQVNPETDAALGYGLGLAIVKRLADALGHRVEVRSRVGRGTLFRLYLRYPMTDNTDTQQALRAIAAQTKTAMLSHLPPVTVSSTTATQHAGNVVDALSPSMSTDHRAFEDFSVVLIDDEPSVSDALATLLNSWGMQTYCATNGSDAQQLVKKYKPQLVISDYHLGQAEFGTDVIEKLRKLHPPIAALVVTGGGDVPTLQTIRRSGLDVLAKPVRPARLRALLQHLLMEKP
jgi:signal transduction histidine kinase/CheY-like chemotaxis protein